ncbi:hypothetical protein [Streptomyces sp. NPDC059893]|uniref:hypothetical protein n=1 Tax=Streptomyces sp. NPDC059893 TaxID=3346990 RepID=UPI0036549E46
MNEGTAALIAGLAGTGGALGGAIIGAVAAVRGARIGAEKAAETARQQVQDQASVDHEHWLRQQRIEAYTGFLSGYDECTKITHQTRRKILDMSPGTGLPEEDFEAVTAAANTLRRLRQRVKLVGPAPVHSRAVELEETVWNYHADLEALADALDSADPDTDYVRDVEYQGMRGTAEAHDAFVRAVGSLLEGADTRRSNVD